MISAVRGLNYQNLTTVIKTITVYIFKTTKNNTKPDDYYNNLPVYYKDYLYKFDTSTKEKTIGASSYVFIAKINSYETTYQNKKQLAQICLDFLLQDK